MESNRRPGWEFTVSRPKTQENKAKISYTETPEPAKRSTKFSRNRKKHLKPRALRQLQVLKTAKGRLPGRNNRYRIAAGVFALLLASGIWLKSSWPLSGNKAEPESGSVQSQVVEVEGQQRDPAKNVASAEDKIGTVSVIVSKQSLTDAERTDPAAFLSKAAQALNAKEKFESAKVGSIYLAVNNDTPESKVQMALFIANNQLVTIYSNEGPISPQGYIDFVNKTIP